MARSKKSDWEKVTRFLSFRPRSEKEVADYLVRKKIPLGPIIKKLKRLKLLDDREFARWFLEQRASFKPKGKMALKQELYQKGIARELVEELLAEVDEASEARKIMEKKKLLPEKMMALLARRGFSWETIKDVQREKKFFP
ncbi:MAG: regulatory protein RecX [Candidatus Shapirobacteria bacterium]